MSTKDFEEKNGGGDELMSTRWSHYYATCRENPRICICFFLGVFRINNLSIYSIQLLYLFFSNILGS